VYRATCAATLWPRKLNRLVRFATQYPLHGFLTESAMRVPPLPRRWINKAQAIINLAADVRGATAIEYTLIIALIVMALVFLIAQIGDFVSTPFQTVAGKL
jgi:Flp pilus assembly pilin Flp